MPVKTLKTVLPIPILGIRTDKPGTLIDERETPDCQNVRIERQQIKKREGWSQIGVVSSGIIQYLGEFNREGVDYFFRITPTKFNWWNNPAAAWTDYTGTALTGSAIIPVSAAVTKLSGKNILVFTNYVDAIRKWETGGNTAALGGSPPIPKFLLGFNRFLLAAYIKDGADIYPERVQWPDYDDPETWTEATNNNAGSYDLDDGFPITGLFRLGSNVIVPKTDSIWLGYLTGDDRVFQFDAVERRLGFLVGNTIQVIPGGLALGLSKHGIVEFNGLRARLAVPGIFEDIRDYTAPNLVNQSFAGIVAELNEYWLFIPLTGQSYPTRLYRYNYVTGQVYKDLVTNITAMGLMTQLSRTLIDDMTGTIDSYTGIIDQIIQESFYPLVILGDSSSKCYKLDYDLKDEAGTAISAYWCSADIVANPGYYSHYTELFFEGKGDTVVISYSTDEGTTYTTLETLTLTSSMATHFIPCDILAEKLRIRVANAVSGENFTMRNLYYKPPVRREAIER